MEELHSKRVFKSSQTFADRRLSEIQVLTCEGNTARIDYRFDQFDVGEVHAGLLGAILEIRLYS